MEFATFDFRHAREVLENRDSWGELLRARDPIDRSRRHPSNAPSLRGRRESLPAGGQTSINRLYRERLAPLGWVGEPRLFPTDQEALRKWKMDFIKDRIGVEGVAFNHAEAVPWTFTRLNIAGESDKVIPGIGSMLGLPSSRPRHSSVGRGWIAQWARSNLRRRGSR